jgi:hypothetical protein
MNHRNRLRALVVSLASVSTLIPVIGCLARGPLDGNQRDSVSAIVTTALPAPDSSGYRHFEPTIAVDRDRSERVFLVTTQQVSGGVFTSRAVAWLSTDSGRTWTSPRPFVADLFPRPLHAGGDPVAVAGPDGDFYAVSLTALQARLGDSVVRQNGVLVGRWDRDSQGFVQFGEPVLYERRRRVGAADSLPDWSVAFPAEQSLRRAIPLRESSGTDKEWAAVDRSAGVRRGAVYVAWNQTGVGPEGHSRLRLARSVDRGATFHTLPPLPVEDQIGTHAVQLGVDGRGAIRGFWVDAARKGVVHAQSTDGGITFTEPVVVRPMKPFVVPAFGHVYADLLNSAVAPFGQQAAVCGRTMPEGEVTERELRAIPFLERAWCATSADGQVWQQGPVDPGLSPGERLALPAVAVTERAFWVLAYRSDSAATRVVVYRQLQGGGPWTEVATLARRAFGSRAMRTGVGEGTIDVGDYIGISAASNRLYATYILPETDDPRSTLVLYVARLELR